jgi:cyclophilin family peptidyl-prolyl cis-trans isomerase
MAGQSEMVSMPIRIKHVRFTWLPATLALMLSLTAFGPAQAADPAPPRVRVTTSMGAFTMELFPDRSPLTVTNFLRYVREGQYSNTVFHRVIQNFVVQGGGVMAGSYTPKQTHDPIPNESGNGLQNKRGTVGLARANPPHSGDCQFYINLADNPDLDPVPTRWGYTVFGRVTEGMEVVERIGVVPTGSAGPFKADAPLTPVVIQKVELIDAGNASMAQPTPDNPAARSMNSAPSEVPTSK